MNNTSGFNPDVLSCLANLSNDEVFTPPNVVNSMLDCLPDSIWKDKNAKFLDPCTKTGVFLREIAKRLIDGLKDEIPDLRERINHIFSKQLYGIAITNLTSLLSRRSIYCSKDANGKYSIFDSALTESGNVFFKDCRHSWSGNSCKFCGASKEKYNRKTELESHAYPFIHNCSFEGLDNIRFDVIIGNPPYQLETGGAGRQAKPIYPLFVNQAKALNPRYLLMIIPSRWYAGGMDSDFRDSMLNDDSIRVLVDYSNAKDCFPDASIGGGVCYFLWERDSKGPCRITNIKNGEETTAERNLNEFSVLVRYNEAVDIIHKVLSKHETTLDTISSPLMPFGFSTNYRGKEEYFEDSVVLYASGESTTYVSRNEVTKGQDLIDKYKILISKTSAEHAGEPDSRGMYGVITSSLRILKPGEVCTHSYFVIGSFDDEKSAEVIYQYLRTKFVRYLVLQCLTAINLNKYVFQFVPLPDDSCITDECLYKKYELSPDQIKLIESTIKEMK